MANEVKDKFGSSTVLTITLASLASSTSGVGRQSDLVDNTTSRYQDIFVWAGVKLGTSPTANKGVYVFAIFEDGATTNLRTDGAGNVDAALTVKNAKCIGVLRTGASPSTGDVLQDRFRIHRPGPKWAIAIVHDTGVALDSTGANHQVRWVGANPEVQ